VTLDDSSPAAPSENNPIAKSGVLPMALATGLDEKKCWEHVGSLKIRPISAGPAA
jgi:hypothetical protein